MARGKVVTWSLLGVIFAGYLLGVYWSVEPDRFDVKAVTQKPSKKITCPM